MDSRFRIQSLLDQIPALHQEVENNNNTERAADATINDDLFQPYHTRSVSQQPLTTAIHHLSAAALGNNVNNNNNGNNNNNALNSRSTSIQAIQQQQQPQPLVSSSSSNPNEARRMSIQQQIQNQLALVHNLTNVPSVSSPPQQQQQQYQRYPSRERTGSTLAQPPRRSESSSNNIIPVTTGAPLNTANQAAHHPSASSSYANTNSVQTFTQLCKSRPQEAAQQLTSWKKHAAATSEALQLAYAEMAQLKEELAKRNASGAGGDFSRNHQMMGMEDDSRTILDGVDEIRIGRARCVIPLSLCLKEQQDLILQDHEDYMDYLERTDQQRNAVPNQNPSRKYNSLQETVSAAVILTLTPQAIFFDEIVGMHYDDDEALAGQSPDGTDEVEPLAELPLHEIDTVVNSDDAFHATNVSVRRSTTNKSRVQIDIITNSGLQLMIEFTNDLSELVKEANHNNNNTSSSFIEYSDETSTRPPLSGAKNNNKNESKNKKNKTEVHRASARAAALATALRQWHPRIIDAAEQSRVAQVRLQQLGHGVNNNNNNTSDSNQLLHLQTLRKGQKPPILMKNQQQQQRKANTPAIVGTTRSQQLQLARVGKSLDNPQSQTGGYTSGRRAGGGTSNSSNSNNNNPQRKQPVASFSPRLPENADWSANELLWAVEDIVDGRAEYNPRSTSANQIKQRNKQTQDHQHQQHHQNALQHMPSPLLSKERQRSTSSSRSRNESSKNHNGTTTSSTSQQQAAGALVGTTSSSLNASNNNRNSLHAFTVVRAHTPTGLAVIHDPEGQFHNLEEATRAAGGVGLLSDIDVFGGGGAAENAGIVTSSDRDAVRKQWMRVFGSTYNERTIQAKTRTLPSHVVELGASFDDQYHQDPASELLGVRRPTPKVHHHNHGSVGGTSTSSRSNSKPRADGGGNNNNYYYQNNSNISDADIILANVRGAADAGIMAQPLPSSVTSMRRSAARDANSTSDGNPIAESSIPRGVTSNFASSMNNASPTPIFRDISKELYAHQYQQQREENQQNQHTSIASQNAALQSIVNSQKSQQQLQQSAITSVVQPSPLSSSSNSSSLLAPKSLADRHLGTATQPPSPSSNTAAPSPLTAAAPSSIPLVFEELPKKPLPPVPTKSSSSPTPAPKTAASSTSVGGGGMAGMMAELLAKQKPIEPITIITSNSSSLQQQQQTSTQKNTVESSLPPTETASTTPTKKMPALPVPGKKLPPPPPASSFSGAKKAPVASAGPGGMGGVFAELLAKRKPTE